MTTIEQLTKDLAAQFSITLWEARSRVEFNVEELELDGDQLTTEQIDEITRCIAADLKAGK